eukprot:jgi/Galph1/3995/GphlegSOOS_G2674.1
MATSSHRNVRNVLVAQVDEWHKAHVVENVLESEGHRSIRLAVPIDLLEQYTTPGMFVKLSNGREKPNIFAIASPVHSSYMEFLVKITHSTSWLCQLEPDTKILISTVMGKGFDLSRLINTEHIYMFATGSGISAIRALKEKKLYYGVRTQERFSYATRFPLWEQSGVRIFRICSTILRNANGKWQGRLHQKNTGALLCGVKGMVEEVSQLLQDTGVHPEKILTNL